MAIDPNDEWLTEFDEFTGIQSVNVPENLLASVKAKIFPDPWAVFGKVAGLHLIVGFLSLGVCNQFGLNPFQTERSLADWFMQIGGHQFCMVACGLLFMASTYVLANLVLTLEELEAVRRHEWLQMGVISLVSLAGFYFFGAELILRFAALWIVGAALGGFISIEASYRLRCRNLGVTL